MVQWDIRSVKLKFRKKKAAHKAAFLCVHLEVLSLVTKFVSMKKLLVLENKIDISKGRLTAARMIEWLNMEFRRLGIKEYVVTAIDRSRFTTNQYEGGACKLYVRFQHVSKTDLEGTFLCFYSLSEYADHMKAGYEMYLTFTQAGNRTSSLSDITIELRKKK